MRSWGGPFGTSPAPTEGPRRNEATTREDGSFELIVGEPGRYSVSAPRRGAPPQLSLATGGDTGRRGLRPRARLLGRPRERPGGGQGNAGGGGPGLREREPQGATRRRRWRGRRHGTRRPIRAPGAARRVSPERAGPWVCGDGTGAGPRRRRRHRPPYRARTRPGDPGPCGECRRAGRAERAGHGPRPGDPVQTVRAPFAQAPGRRQLRPRKPARQASRQPLCGFGDRGFAIRAGVEAPAPATSPSPFDPGGGLRLRVPGADNAPSSRAPSRRCAA